MENNHAPADAIRRVLVSSYSLLRLKLPTVGQGLWRKGGIATLVAAGLFLGSEANAVTISWSSQLNIAGDTEVATSGSLLYAYNIRNATYTVNRVTFAAGNSFTSLGGGNVTLSGFTNKLNSGASPIVAGSISVDYSAMLGGFAYSSPVGAGTGSVTLNNLIVGKEYLVQIWVADYRKDTNARTQSLDHGPLTLHYMTGNGSTAGSGTGQYSIGLFKADATSQTISLTANESLQINAIQVRDVTPTVTGTTYYVDPAGDDSNNGTSSDTPWKSLAKVNGTTFQPGDKILFKRGGTWSGTLSPKGAGTDAAQNTLGSYGSGAKPLIDGAGAGTVISISGQSYWTIDGFEVTNFAGGAGGARSGIRVGGGGDGSTIRRIRILNNDVHDIQATPNVNDGARNWGGVFVWIDEPGKADDILIEGNTSTEIQGQGISFWGEFDNNYNDPASMNYDNCSPHVVVRGNRVWRTSGDGLLVLGGDNELVEYNEVAYAGVLASNGNAIAAAWPSRHRNGVWQYNHVHHTVWQNANDSTAFDNDGYVDGITYFQYNYTHDNQGGFFMEYRWQWDYGKSIVRYNVSVNDGRDNYARIVFSNRPSDVYNNVFYNPGMQLDVYNGYAGLYHNFSNNIYVGASRTSTFDSQGHYYNNHFHGGVTPPAASGTNVNNVAEDPLFVAPNTTGNLAGFILQSGSPCRSFGTAIPISVLSVITPGSGTELTSNGGKDFWSVGVPATAPHRGASQINAIGNYTSTPSYVHVSGPFSVVVPFSGSSAATFTATVHDQNFQPLAAPAVTWSLSPTVAGCSVDSNGAVTISSAAAGQRFAVTATSGTGSHTFSFSTVAPVWTNSAGTGIWNTTDANWSGLTWADGGDATFAHTSSAQTITISGNRSADDVMIGNRTNNANYTFTGGSLAANTLTLQGETSTGPTVSETNLASTNVNVAGRAGLGRGRLIVSGNTTLTADTIGSSGTGGLGDWGFLRIQDNAVVTAINGLSGDTTAWGLELNGGTLITKSLWAAPWAGQSRLIFNGTLIKANAGSSVENPSFITLQSNGHNDPPVIDAGGAKFDTNGHDIAIATALQGSGPLTKSGAGTLTLSGGWNYTGSTSILGGTFASGAAAGSSNTIYALTLGSGTLAALNAGDANLGNFQLRGNVTVGGSSTSIISADARVVAGETRTFTVAPNGDLSSIDLLVSGKLGHHNGTAWGFAIKAGEGVMKISGVNEIGSLTVNAGKLILENSGIGGMWNGGLVNNAQTELSVTGSGSVSFSQAIQGSGSITKTGAGTLVLSGSNSYTGNTAVEAGTLRLGAAFMADTSTVSIASAAKIDLAFTGSDTVRQLFINGVQQPRGIWTAARDGGHFAGTGSLVVTEGPDPDADGTWTSSLDGNWGNFNNWQNSIIANGAHWTATFNQTIGTTITVDAGRTIGNLVFENANFIIAGEPLTLASSSGTSSVTVGAGRTVIAATALTGSVGLQKSGDGTLALGAANSYSGATTVSSGTLRVMADTSAGISIANAGFETPPFAENGWSYAPAGSSWSFNAAGIGRNGSPWVTTAPEGVQSGFVQNNGTLSQTLTVTTGGFYDLSFKAANRPGYADSGIAVQIDGATVKIYPAGTFASSGTFQTFVVRGFQLDAGSRILTFAGSQNGADSATAIDDVRLTGYAAGSLPVGTALGLTGGTLQLDVAQTVASLAGNAGSNVINHIALTVGDASLSIFEGVISGAGSLVKAGPGTLTLTGNNSYTGPTAVNAGTLLVHGTQFSATGEINVAANATLGGNGSVGGAITVQTNGTLAPGTSIGTLTAASAAINGTLAIELDGSSADRLNTTGNLNITNATLALIGTPTAAELIIASFDSLTGTNFASVTGLPAGYEVTYDLTAKQIKLAAVNTGFAGWIDDFAVSNPAAAADPDFDGIPNALEYVLGGDPSQSDSSLAPKASIESDNLVFTFDRVDSSETSDVTLVVEAGTTLTTWPETYTIGANTATSSSGVDIQENDVAPDGITVTVPHNGATSKFARLRAWISP